MPRSARPPRGSVGGAGRAEAVARWDDGLEGESETERQGLTTMVPFM